MLLKRNYCIKLWPDAVDAFYFDDEPKTTKEVLACIAKGTPIVGKTISRLHILETLGILSASLLGGGERTQTHLVVARGGRN